MEYCKDGTLRDLMNKKLALKRLKPQISLYESGFTNEEINKYIK